MGNRTYRTDAEWEQLVALFHKTPGASKRSFCSKHGLSYSTFSKRLNQAILASENESNARHSRSCDLPPFIALHERTEPEAQMEVCLSNGRRVIIKGSPDLRALQALLKILEG